jgi:hypothetical protein
VEILLLLKRIVTDLRQVRADLATRRGGICCRQIGSLGGLGIVRSGSEADVAGVSKNCASARIRLSVESGMAVGDTDAFRQHRAASRSQFFALIQAMIFQMSSSLLMISP